MMFTAPSQWRALTIGEDARIAAPPGAYAFEVYPRGTAVDPGTRIETQRPASVRDFGAGVWLPPSSPLPLIDNAVNVSAIGGIARHCDIVFFVR